MTLDIIIVNWNTADTTKKCVDSIIKYVNNISYQITVVDNASTDNSIQLLEKIDNRRLKIIKNQFNFGYAKACNIGASQAKAKYLLFLNSDILFIDNSLKLLIDYYNTTKKIGAIGPKYLNPDLTPQASVFPKQTIINAFKQYFLNQPFTFSKYTPDSNSIQKVWSISGGCILIKNSIFKKIGKWNQDYFMYYEDLDICRRLIKNGFNIIYYPLAKVIHYHGLSGKKVAPNNNQWKRLIPSSIKYHGFVKHVLLTSILYLGQKWQKFLKKI